MFLFVFCRSVAQELSDAILTMVANANVMMKKARQVPAGVVGAKGPPGPPGGPIAHPNMPGLTNPNPASTTNTLIHHTHKADCHFRSSAGNICHFIVTSRA